MMNKQASISLIVCLTVFITVGCRQSTSTDTSSGQQVKTVMESIQKKITNKNISSVQTEAKKLYNIMKTHKATDPETCKKPDYIKLEADCLNSITELISAKDIDASTESLGKIIPTCSACHNEYKSK